MNRKALKAQLIEGLLHVIKNISDPVYQENAWIKILPNYCSTFETTRDNLVDDFDVEEIVRNYKKYCITESQANLLQHFYNQYDKYSYDKYDEYVKEILADPEWHKIRELAQEVIDAFNRHPGWKNPT